MRAHYWPASSGGWLGFVTPARVLLVGHEPEQAERDELWSLLTAVGEAQAVLDRLAAGGIAATPPFALIEFEGVAVRAFVRGAVAVNGELSSGKASVSGSGVSTWAEHLFSDARTLAITIEDSAPLDSPGKLPLVQGMAIIAALELDAAAKTKDGAEDPGSGYDFLFGETVYRTLTSVDGNTTPSAVVAELKAQRRAAARRKDGVAAPVLVLPDGSLRPLTMPVIVGRAPTVPALAGKEIPVLVTLGNGSQDISRSHARFAMDGESIVITDLHSRNGTVVVMPGKSPQRLRAGEPTVVIVGTIVDFGEGIALTIEER